VPESNELPRDVRSAVPALRSESRAARSNPLDRTDQTEQYRVVYSESQRALDDQRDELQGLRTRAVQFTAFVSAATAFLVGTGLHATDRNGQFYALAGTASALSLLSIVSLAMLLIPRNWTYRMTPRDLIDKVIEKEGIQRPTDDLFLKRMALTYGEMSDENEPKLKKLRTWYIRLIIAGSLQVIVWAALIWYKG